MRIDLGYLKNGGRPALCTAQHLPCHVYAHNVKVWAQAQQFERAVARTAAHVEQSQSCAAWWKMACHFAHAIAPNAIICQALVKRRDPIK